MKQYVCIKEYVTSEGDVAFKKGKIYDLASNGMLYSELVGVKYFLTEQFKKVNFKRHKPVKSFGGKGLFDPHLSTSNAYGIWTGRTITKDVVDRINSTYNIVTTNPTNNGVWVDEFTKFTEKESTLKVDGKEVMRIDANGNIVDSVVESVVKKFQDRSRVGIEKYGTTLAENNSLTTLQWIDEAQAEAMDFCLYLERLKKQF